MNRHTQALLGILLATASSCTAQNLDELGIQIHGYATQGFLYTTNNNILTTTSSSGSPNWTETVVNLSAQPSPRLRFAVQARYELLGNYSNSITIDYAAADFKMNDRFGLRLGKVKVPSGLFNETQDIDPSYPWGLLPQSVYPIASRNGQLSLFGGVLYGTLGEGTPKLGKLEYRGWSGEVSLASNDGYFLPYDEAGLDLSTGLKYVENGAALRWRTPLPGLLLGASDSRENQGSGAVSTGNGTYTGNFASEPSNTYNYFARYEKSKLMVAGEYSRKFATGLFEFTGIPTESVTIDFRAWYGMATYQVTSKLTAGLYESQLFNRKDTLGPGHYSKDWTLSGRYDFGQFFYAKAEEHFIQGTFQYFDTNLNPGGLKPSTKLTILKAGVSF